MWTVLAVMPLPGRQEKNIPWLKNAIQNKWRLWREVVVIVEPGLATPWNDRGAKALPTLRAGDLKNNQVFVINMAFKGAATTARHYRCGADPFRRVPCDVLA